MLTGKNGRQVRSHNRSAVLRHLLHQGVASRAQLAEWTGLSGTTITHLISDLVEQGIVLEEGAAPSGHLGRPRTALRLNPHARFAIGVHIGIGTLRVGLTNLKAELLQNVIVEFEPKQPWEQVLNRIADCVLSLATRCKAPQTLLGVGVGASGLVDYQNGVNVFAPNLGWHDVPMRDWLQERVGLPVVVDNNVRAMALGEWLFGAYRGTSSLAFVYGRVGVGAGFIVNGSLLRGSGAGAGEIGHTVMIPNGGMLCSCGQRGCLETLVSESVLVRAAAALAAQHPGSLLAEYWQRADLPKPVDRLLEAARCGDPHALNLIETSSRYLGIALANIVNTLNPELILLGGLFAQGSDLFLPIAERVMRECAFAGLGERVRLDKTTFGWRAGVIGAAALALSTFFYGAENP